MKTTHATTLTDEELVKKIVETNNTHLFAILYDRYSNVVYSKCYGFSVNKEEAQDLTHDVFIKLFVKLRSFKGRSKFSTWLYSFTYNFCVNYVQRNNEKKKQKVTIVTDNIKENNSLNEEVDDTTLFELKSDKLAKALEVIDPQDKMILLMKYHDDMSIQEIQNILNLGASAVKMRIKRAKERVVKAYQEI